MRSTTVLGTLIIGISFLLSPTTTKAQSNDESVVIGEKLKFYSDVMEEEREIWVYKPDDYRSSEDSFPVIYLLDGPGNFHHTTGTVRFLTKNGRMPEMIVVGIANTDRTRDLTPMNTSDTTGRFPTSGGADQFLDFLSSELIPYVEEHFRTKPYKILIGHSFGGLFANHALVHRSELFDDYISISPSLWWDEQKLVDQAQHYFEKNKDQKGYLFMTMGNEGGAMLGGAWKFASVLEESAPEDFHWKFVLMEEETHGSIPSRSTYQGLEFVFADWYLPRPIELFETGGMAALDNHYQKIANRWGYKVKVPEQTLNQIGYILLNQDKLDEAIQVFKRNVEAYPTSSNVYDSLGEAFMKKGDNEKAIKYYKKSLDINPGNENGKEMLKKMGVDMASLNLVISLPESILDKYVGTYQTPEFEVLVIREGKQLFGKPSGQPRAELFALSETEFFTKMVEARVIFGLDAQGQSTSITIKMDGRDMVGKKVK
jgi:predicted alpha/beta superfamily hydrolase